MSVLSLHASLLQVKYVGTILCSFLSYPSAENYSKQFPDYIVINELFVSHNLVGPPFPPQYSSYDEQQYYEILTIFDQLNGVVAPIVMGQFNHGPLSPREHIAPMFPFHHGLMSAGGFVSPYVLLDGRCTSCADNLEMSQSYISGMMDHEFLRPDSLEVSCEVGKFIGTLRRDFQKPNCNSVC